MCLNEYYLHAIEVYQLDYDITNAKTQFLQIGAHAKKKSQKIIYMTIKKKINFGAYGLELMLRK